jgi:NAD(P)-dependent dehydrogenase (short-subunit alcohol dehydrogenase family)
MNIVVTGATGAIGSALATLLHARGEKLMLCGRSDEKLEALNRALGGAHQTAAAELTDAAGCAVSQAKAVQLGVIGGIPHCVESTNTRHDCTLQFQLRRAAGIAADPHAGRCRISGQKKGRRTPPP